MKKYYNENTVIFLDNEFIKAADAQIDLFGQSLHYGFGAFEGLRSYGTHNGTRIFKAEEHFERLKESCVEVGLDYPWDNKSLIEKTYALLEQNKLRSAYIRPLVFTGSNMHLLSGAVSHIMIAAWEWGPFLGQNLLKVCVSDIQRPHPRSFTPDAKITGQYINSIRSTSAAVQKGFDEAILLDHEGFVAQASSENIFIEKDYKIYTPPLGNIFPGITRQTIIDICHALNFEVLEKRLSVKEVHEADSAFLSGTASEVIGIQQIDDVIYPEEWEQTIGASIQRKYKSLVLEQENYEVII